MASFRTSLPALALSLALAACSAQAPPAASAAPESPATASATAPAAAASTAPASATSAGCPDADFPAFLKRFSAEIAVQEKATADPLTMIQIDPEAQPEPAPVTREVPLAQVKWPVIPDLAAVRSSGREVVVSQQGDGQQVLVRTPDTGDQQVYHFAQRPCWTLIKVDDQAL